VTDKGGDTAGIAAEHALGTPGTRRQGPGRGQVPAGAGRRLGSAPSKELLTDLNGLDGVTDCAELIRRSRQISSGRPVPLTRGISPEPRMTRWLSGMMWRRGEASRRSWRTAVARPCAQGDRILQLRREPGGSSEKSMELIAGTKSGQLLRDVGVRQNDDAGSVGTATSFIEGDISAHPPRLPALAGPAIWPGPPGLLTC